MLCEISKSTPSVTKLAVEHSEGFYSYPGFFPNLREINMYRTAGLPACFDPNLKLKLELKLLNFDYWKDMYLWCHHRDGTVDKILEDKLPVKSGSGERETGEDVSGGGLAVGIWIQAVHETPTLSSAFVKIKKRRHEFHFCISLEA